MEDTTGACKVIADPATGELPGAHQMGYQASILIQPLIQGMSLGQTVTEMARGQYCFENAVAERWFAIPQDRDRDDHPGDQRAGPRRRLRLHPAVQPHLRHST